jgi:hypothetical protein
MNLSSFFSAPSAFCGKRSTTEDAEEHGEKKKIKTRNMLHLIYLVIKNRGKNKILER